MQHAQDMAFRQNLTVGTRPPLLPSPPLNPRDPFIHNVLEEMRADADEMADYKEKLITDFEGARRRIASREILSILVDDCRMRKF